MRFLNNVRLADKRSPPSAKKSFLDLPHEIRERIYSFVFNDLRLKLDEQVLWQFRGSQCEETRLLKAPTFRGIDLLLVGKQHHDEIRSVLFRHATIVIPTIWTIFYVNKYQYLRSSIRHINLRISFWQGSCGWGEDGLDHLISAVNDWPSLRTINLHFPQNELHWKGEDAFYRPVATCSRGSISCSKSARSIVSRLLQSGVPEAVPPSGVVDDLLQSKFAWKRDIIINVEMKVKVKGFPGAVRGLRWNCRKRSMLGPPQARGLHFGWIDVVGRMSLVDQVLRFEAERCGYEIPQGL